MIENIDTLEILERIAANGTAPKAGCSLFGFGYEDAFDRLRDKYLVKKFKRGGSGEKFVVGPYGSGKTHFLRHLMEIARGLDCVTSEVSLNKTVDFTESLVVYREVVRELVAPDEGKGVKGLLRSIRDRVASIADNPEEGDRLVSMWAAGLEEAQLNLVELGRISKRAFDALIANEEDLLESCCRWLGGEFFDRALCKQLEVSTVSKTEQALFAKRAFLSWLQLIRHAGFAGTLVCFDEAEQGFSVDKKKMQKILSMLQSDINAVADLERGSALIVYALTPDVVERMEDFAALQQRVSDPGPNQGFFDGNTLAPKIDLTMRREDVTEELEGMASALVDLFYSRHGNEITIDAATVRQRVSQIAQEVSATEMSSSNRRTLMKRVATMLLTVFDDGVLDEVPRPVEDEDEV